MATRFVGQFSIFKTTILGRKTLGIAVEESLAVSATADLAVNEFAELDVRESMIWTGATAIQSIACEGAGAATF